jgi:hypothetical protein
MQIMDESDMMIVDDANEGDQAHVFDLTSAAQGQNEPVAQFSPKYQIQAPEPVEPARVSSQKQPDVIMLDEQPQVISLEEDQREKQPVEQAALPVPV